LFFVCISSLRFLVLYSFLVLKDFVVLCKFRELQLSFRSKKPHVFRMPEPKKSCHSGKNQKMNIFWFLPGIHCGHKIL
jgi:hypothetical protein